MWSMDAISCSHSLRTQIAQKTNVRMLNVNCKKLKPKKMGEIVIEW